jgi:hypothetical protein
MGEKGREKGRGVRRRGSENIIKSQKFYLQACGRTAQEYEETF